MTATPPDISIPESMKPADGRFGSGPSKIRPEAVDALVAAAPTYLGTSHRQAGVRFVVGALRNLLAEVLRLPDGYEVLLGNGGTTAFWDAAVFGLIEERSQHLSFGEFSAKFAAGVAAAPHLSAPSVIASEPGTHPLPVAEDGIDAYCLTQNETSTGVAMPLSRPAPDGLVLVDATSAACGLRVDLPDVDAYYFAPQKALASDGGLWLAVCSPAAVERIERLAASDRWIPAFLDLAVALDNSRKDQTYNTPPLASIFLAGQQIEWIAHNGGLEWAAKRSEESSGHLYAWAEERPFAAPFVADPAMRSAVVATIDFEGVDATAIASVLRANGILDTESYRKLGRNQLRIACFPAIDPDDVRALTACLDHVVDHLT